jgi:hypothetical protein
MPPWHTWLFDPFVFRPKPFEETSMADDKSKYQCLVDALANSGLKLPEIKPGSEVEELAPMRNTALPPPNDAVDFTYTTADGKLALVGALDGLSNGSTSEYHMSRTKDFSLATFNSDNSFSSNTRSGGLDVKTGKETYYGPPAKPGTIGETVDKIIKCRDPKVS